ncbi:hypothetical protein DICPUDRAFT_46322 [Dictyostelium purpureum]|uniref:2'-phosphotransferase n=1 Tax=Dictyostelium purpureum TaxID=5786 RepID=F0ZEB7_DICPU|nr:uncharacterized protein DICPUDRAFT_46322 [Dictyostelium purpureum]EGC37728.1 hypothetical protein DICPUDRAFT_46322 [Dictyostelium purpureum]|eukprot:XP_003285749.1 hypothetical protein DICPUDRAFT_46322 [Dictyostelium purpureum]
MSYQSITSNNKKSLVQLSKTLSYILRHSAVKEGLNISKDGYVSVDELLKHKLFSQYTFKDIQEVVDTNDKKRYNLKKGEGENSEKYFICANQGHSISDVDEVDLKRIESVDEVESVVHGTYKKHLKSILENGLQKMERNHIHFAVGLPGEGQVISGMRGSCDMVIYIDLQKCLDDDIPMFLSKNNVVLTNGKDNNGILPIKYFTKIVDKNNVTIWQR